MIRYTLKCDQGHGFESWFADAAAYDGLAAAQQLACPICGSMAIEKALMAPAVRAKTPDQAAVADQATAPAGPPSPAQPPALAHPQAAALEAAIAELRRHVEAHSEYVGDDFAAEARRMHEGESPDRAIHGEARPEEARKLLEDGIPVAPLPFLPARKVN